MTSILALDPGTEETGWAIYASDAMNIWRIVDSGIDKNDDVLMKVHCICHEVTHLAIEMIASYGMPVGKETFETCVWIGRFMQNWKNPDAVILVYRKDVKMHLCGSLKAKDGNIRQALIDLLGPPGTKKNPGGTYGVKSHAWAALAVAETVRAYLAAQS